MQLYLKNIGIRFILISIIINYSCSGQTNKYLIQSTVKYNAYISQLIKENSGNNIKDSISIINFLNEFSEIMDSITGVKDELPTLEIENIPEYEASIPFYDDSLLVIDLSNVYKEERNIFFNALEYKLKEEAKIYFKKKVIVRFLSYPDYTIQDIFETK